MSDFSIFNPFKKGIFEFVRVDNSGYEDATYEKKKS